MKADLEETIAQIDNFINWKDSDKIRFFAWFLISKLGMERFYPADIRDCYDSLNIQKPKDVNPFLASMYNKKPPDIIREKNGYILERRLRTTLEEKYGKRLASIKVDQILLDLPSKISKDSEKSFLEEAINCYRAKAFRSAIVMTWNLVFHCFCNYIFNKPNLLFDFNSQLPKSFPKARILDIKKREDFDELKESEVLQVSRSANIITNDIFKILKEKLDKRNTAAHPSAVIIFPHTSEEYIIDIVNNVLLKIL